MAKKHKHKAKRSAKKAMKAMKKHKPMSAALVALGGFATSILTSDKLRDAVEVLLGNALSRLAKSFVDTRDGLKELADGAGEDEHAAAH
jgi:hypothetical protein